MDTLSVSSANQRVKLLRKFERKFRTDRWTFPMSAREPQAPARHGWSQMASQNPPRSSDDMILFALEQALREVWAVLKAHDPHGYLDKDDGLQKAIADKLMALADSGVTDPQELRRRTLENFDFKPPH